MADTEIADLLEDDEESTEEIPDTDEYDDGYGDDEEETTEDVEEEAEVPVPAPRAPASFEIPTILSAEDRQYGEALFTPQQLGFLEVMNARSFAAGQASVAAANASVDNTLADASPEYRRLVVPRIQTVISRMTPQQRADPRAADDALYVVMSEEARETGESAIQVMQRHLQMRGATTVQKPRTAPAPKPAGTRAPSPSNAGRGPVVRSSAGGSGKYKLIGEALGITAAEAERMGL